MTGVGRRGRLVGLVRHLRGVCVTLLVLLALARKASPQIPAASVVDVESVYLFDFAKFVRWPSGGEHPTITLCVAGPGSYGDRLKQVVQGEKINGRSLAVRAVQRADGVAGCDVLFLSASLKEKAEPILAAASGKPVLTVGDSLTFLDRGGMIQFTMIDSRVRFAVDMESVARGGLGLSSELLKVAVRVRGAAGPVGGEETP